jgi:sugar lactone lactonase YvrE
MPKEAAMTSIRVLRLGRWGFILLAIGLVGAELAGRPAATTGDFPAFTQMAYTPSGVAVDKVGNVYVSTREGGRGIIWKYTPDGTSSLIADLGQAVIYGLLCQANGDVYAAMATGPDQGVYRIDRDGEAERLPGSEQIVFPNGLAFDDRGNLYVTESFSGGPGAYGQGGIWRFPPGGEAQLWVRDPLLTGLGILGSPVGANGIACYHGDLFVTNTDKGSILRVPVAADGTPGDLELWKTLGPVPESPLAGLPIMPDGLVLDVHGNLYLTVLSRCAIVRVSLQDKTQETVAVLGSTGTAPSALLDTPASLAFGTGAGEQQNLFVTNLGMMAVIAPGRPWPGRALVKIPAGVPGRPLH